jgi:hypothetical protein
MHRLQLGRLFLSKRNLGLRGIRALQHRPTSMGGDAFSCHRPTLIKTSASLTQFVACVVANSIRVWYDTAARRADRLPATVRRCVGMERTPQVVWRMAKPTSRGSRLVYGH